MIPQLNNQSSLDRYDPADWMPNRAQQRFLAAWMSQKYSIIGGMWGWGTGKTRLIPYIMQAQWEMDGNVNGAYVTDSLGRGAKTIGLECAKILEPIGWRFNSYYKGAPAPHWVSPTVNGQQSIVWVLSWKRPKTKSIGANSIEGPDLGYILLDEAQVMQTEEVGAAMLGRIRSAGKGRGTVGIIGKPCFRPWWRSFCEARNGYFFTAPSQCNRANIPDYENWVASLSRREVLENIMAMPQPPIGSVFDDWMPTEYPDGNIAPTGWRPESWMRITATWDFGVRSPALLLIAHDPRLGPNGCDVVFGEVMPDNVSVFEVCRLARRGVEGVFPGVWPAHRSHDMPKGSLPLHAVYGDRSGRNRRDDQSLSSAITDVESSPHVGGLGIRCWYTDDPKRTNVLGGIKLLWRMICNNAGERTLLCSRELWNRGSQGSGRSFARSINEYRWASSHRDVPDKTNGADHGADALRYWAINARWPADVGMGEARAAFKQERPRGPGIRPAGSDR